MNTSLLSIAEAAERLQVRPSYIHELVAKGRLSFVGAQALDAGEVDRLAQLMKKLRSEGIATLVNIAVTSDRDL